MAQVKTQDVLVKIGSTVVAGQKSASLNMSQSPINVTTKDDNGWKKEIAGEKSWTVSCESLFMVDDQGQEAVLTAFAAGTEVELELSNTGSTYIRKGKAIIVSIDEQAGENDVVSFSVNFNGVGALSTTSA